MKTEDNPEIQEQFAKLREKAIALLPTRNAQSPEFSSLEDAQRLITELQVHQIELEMQNDELRQIQLQLAVEREKYADLYNFAPVAYFTFDERDLILDLNLTAAEMLVNERKFLIGRPISPYLTSASLQTFVEHRQHALETGLPQVCELTLRPRDGTQIYVQTRTVALSAAPQTPQRWRSVMTDITERKLADQKLRQQAAWSQLISDAVIATDMNLIITSWNEAATRIYGWHAEETLGREVDELLKTEFLSVTQRAAQAVLAQTGVWRGPLRQQTKDGERLYLEASTTLLKDAAGNLLGGITVNRDMTALKMDEDILQARWRITEYATGHALSELLQYALDELCGLTESPIGFFHFVEPDQRTLSLQAWSTRTLQEMCRAEGKGHHYEIDRAGVWVDCVRQGRPLIHNDYASLPHRKGLPEGHAPILREMIFPIWRSQKIVAIIGVGNKPANYTQTDLDYASRLADLIWDITARKQAEIELAEKEVQYRTLADSGLALIWTSGVDRLCTYFNEPWLRFTGRTLEQEMGNGWAEGVHPQDFERCLQTYVTAFDRRESFEMEYRLRHVSGEYRWLQDLGTPNYNTNGDFIGYLGHCFDITERKQAEEKIRAALTEKEMLLRELNHRTKNNLNLVSSLVELQASASESEPFQALALTLGNRIESIALVHQMLYQAPNLAQIDLSEYARELVSHLISGLALAPEQITVEIDATPTFVGINTAIPCGQILNELILNALKYAFPQGRPGKLTIQIHQTEAGQVRLRVADDGIGLPADFDPDSTESLGMIIVRMLVKQLRGQMTMESKAGFACEVRFLENGQSA